MMHASLYNPLMTNEQLENTELLSNKAFKLSQPRKKTHNFIVEVNSVT
jgi:hypothetical protein